VEHRGGLAQRLGLTGAGAVLPGRNEPGVRLSGCGRRGSRDRLNAPEADTRGHGACDHDRRGLEDDAGADRRATARDGPSSSTKERRE
jgi:hypothetical protein